MEYIVKWSEGQSVVDTEAEALQTVNNLLDSSSVEISEITVWEAKRMSIGISLKVAG